MFALSWLSGDAARAVNIKRKTVAIAPFCGGGAMLQNSK